MSSVHSTHCCTQHGCKYGDKDCPVVLGIEKQGYPCEDCGSGETVQSVIRKQIRARFKEIDAFWDKKTVFVHRRAMILGLFLGTSMGSLFTLLIVVLVIGINR
jgi:hypothetical protein